MNTENTPLVYHYPLVGSKRKGDQFYAYLTHTGLALFAALVLSVLVRLPLNVFTLHPLFNVIMLVSVTEGVVLLQTTSTQEEKEKGLEYHAIVQSIASFSFVVAGTAIFVNKYLLNKEHLTSVHGYLGAFVFVYMVIQVLFGLTIAFFRHLYGSEFAAKQLWKYHRVSGYFLLILLWTTAQLGVRADYMYNNLWSRHLIWLHWVAVFLVAAGVFGRIRVSKWGITL
ncbi:hypothetical protein BDF14DRAFT_1822953 [Spinellus fusiger]|nr:hypothetical protein BDF14DRAFT_1822953 [Spinellus fusiger]